MYIFRRLALLLVLLYATPALSGSYICEKIRDVFRGAALPLSVLIRASAFDTVLYAASCRHYETEGFQLKPESPEALLAWLVTKANGRRHEGKLLESLDRILGARLSDLNAEEVKVRARLNSYAEHVISQKSLSLKWGWPPVVREGKPWGLKELFEFASLVAELEAVSSLTREEYLGIMDRYESELVTFRWHRKLVMDVLKANLEGGASDIPWLRKPGLIGDFKKRHERTLQVGALLTAQAMYTGLLYKMVGPTWEALFPAYIPSVDLLQNLSLKQRFLDLYKERGLDAALVAVYDLIAARAPNSLSLRSEERLLLFSWGLRRAQQVYAAIFWIGLLPTFLDAGIVGYRAHEFQRIALSVTEAEKRVELGKLSQEELNAVHESRAMAAYLDFNPRPSDEAVEFAAFLAPQTRDKPPGKILTENQDHFSQFGVSDQTFIRAWLMDRRGSFLLVGAKNGP